MNRISNRHGTFKVHGLTRTGTHNSWAAMKRRCFYQRHEHFSCYGGRGIKVCERWLLFENFFADMGARPKGCTLERINPDGDYCPENCRWATQVEQCRNRRNNRKITLNAETLTLAEWSTRTGLDASKIFYRLKAGWSVNRALGFHNDQENPPVLPGFMTGHQQNVFGSN